MHPSHDTPRQVRAAHVKNLPPLSPPVETAIFMVVLGGFYLTSRFNFLLFHSLAELCTVIVAWGVFVIAWEARNFTTNNYLLFLGISSPFFAGIDTLHMLAYKGMGVFPGNDANLPTQLWIAARYLQGIGFLMAPVFISRPLPKKPVFAGFLLATGVLLATIFYWGIFPICFAEGRGLTPFKVISEYLISAMFLASLLLLFRVRETFNPAVFRLVATAMIMTACSELLFTFYSSIYGLSIVLGHYFKLGAFFLIYRAIIRTGLADPYELIFRQLRKSEEALAKSNCKLEKRLNQATEYLLENEEKFRTLSESANDAIIMMEDAGNIVFWNKAAEKIFGYSSQEMLGKEGHLLLAPQRDHDAYKRGFERFAATGQGPFIGKTLELTAVRKDGSEFQIELSVSVVKLKGRWHSTGIARDIMERKQAEMALCRAKSAAEAASLAKTEFIANMSHEIRTPLTAIIGFSDVLADCLFGPLNERQRSYVGNIKMNGIRLQDLLINVLDLAQVEFHSGTLELATFPLKDVITPPLDIFRQEAAARNIRLELVMGSEKNLLMEGDAEKLKKVLFQLLSNAMKFTPDGGSVCVIVRKVSSSKFQVSSSNLKPETLNLKPDTDFVEISVEDTGIGIRPENIPRLFEEFNQLESPYTKRFAGTGLGLALARKLADMHGGEIVVESEPGKGSRFTFTLPVRQQG